MWRMQVIRLMVWEQYLFKGFLSFSRPAHDEFEIVAQSYRSTNALSDKIFFGMVDYDEGAEIFQTVCPQSLSFNDLIYLW